MTPESVMTIGREAMEVTLLVLPPMLLTALIIGPLGQYFPGSYPN